MNALTESQSPEELRAWIEAVADVAVLDMQRGAGGGSREAWRVDAKSATGERRTLFVRRDAGVGPVSGSPLTLAREAAVVRAVAKRGIPASRIVAVDDEADVVLADFIDGAGSPEDVADLIGSERQNYVIYNFVDTMARVHGLDPEDLRHELPALPVPTTAEEHATLELDQWEGLYAEKATAPDPILAATFTWLRRNAPTAVQRTVLVHGDCGPGNFLFDPETDRVTALLDWEFAHFGDPADDLAWWAFRDNGTFPDYEQALRRWAAKTGLSVDRKAITYYGVFVLARVTVCAVRGLANAGATIDNSVWHVLLPMMHAALAHLLADIHAVDHDSTCPDLGESPRNEFDRILATLGRDLVSTITPDLKNPDALKRARGDALLIAYLSQAHPLEAAIDQATVEDLTSVLPSRPGSATEGLQALEIQIRESGALSDEVLRVLCRSADREMLPWHRLGLGALGGDKAYPAAYAPNAGS
ncbi:phosphotransferase family protein [Mycobacterium sp. OAE908]|uniref:phosphotransferase family protein n=1 Tax=Mycobacterium sp. OAE908 TaxID=2817899 RepID=UPI001AE86F5C